MYLRVEINKRYAKTGEPVEITESIEIAANVKAAYVSHKVHKIGKFDPAANEFIVIDSALHRYVDVDSSFVGLPAMIFGSPGISFSHASEGYRHIVFTFHSRISGVFMITPSWGLRESETIVSGQPIVLVVGQ